MSQESSEQPKRRIVSSKSGSERPIPWKLIASGLILFHLCAVVLPPLAFQTIGADGPSPLIGTIIKPFEGYGQFLHLDRGYAFFAPDPGPSRLIQAAVVQSDGRVDERLYPDLDNQWPRLLYHRHFMLTEYLSNIYRPPGPPEELFESQPSVAERWQQERARYEYVRQSMTDHLRHANDGKQVAIRRIEHVLPRLEQFVQEPIELDDPRLYNVLLDQPILEPTDAPASEASDLESDPDEIPPPAVPSLEPLSPPDAAEQAEAAR